MLDIGFPEFLLISFVLLIVVGPKDLPKVLRSITTFIRKIKTMASQFHSGIDDLANESEISDLRKEVSKIENNSCLLYTSPSPRDRQKSRMPSSA